MGLGSFPIDFVEAVLSQLNGKKEEDVSESSNITVSWRYILAHAFTDSIGGKAKNAVLDEIDDDDDIVDDYEEIAKGIDVYDGEQGPRDAKESNHIKTILNSLISDPGAYLERQGNLENEDEGLAVESPGEISIFLPLVSCLRAKCFSDITPKPSLRGEDPTPHPETRSINQLPETSTSNISSQGQCYVEHLSVFFSGAYIIIY